MADQLWFVPSVRHGGLPAGGAHGRAEQESVFGVGAGGLQGVRDVRLRFAVAGVADVRGLRPGAITRRVPHPGTPAAEEEQRPYVQLATADLAWRYSPGPDQHGRLRPWLMLVAAPSGQISVAGGRATLHPDVLAVHDPAQASVWAHVQLRAPGADPATGIARVLCARQFPAGATFAAETDHTAALVVPWTADGAPAWATGQPGPATVDCLDWWTFRTGSAGGFKDLAMALRPGDDDPLGFVTVHLDDAGTTIPVPGALTSALPAQPGPVALDFHLIGTDAVDGRDVVGPPAYGAPWAGDRQVRDRTRSAQGAAEPTWAWPEQVNADLGRRVVAALGRQAGVDLQEEIITAAARAWRAGPAASAMMSGLALGLAASAALWRRRLPDDGPARAALLGPASGRLPTEAHDGLGRSLRDVLAGPPGADQQAFPVSLLGPVGSRALRRGGPAARLARPHAADLPAVAGAAAHPPRLPDSPAEQATAGADPDDLDPGHLDTALHWSSADHGQPATDEALRGFLGVLHMLEHYPPRGPEQPERRPLDVAAVGGLLAAVLDPAAGAPPARRRIEARVVGVDPARILLPLEDCPDIDLPAWRYLRDRAPHWLLPGADTLSPGEVVSLQTNEDFVEQFLVGLSQQSVAELRWRQHPVRAGCTPMRRFWDRTPSAAGGRRDDVVGVAAWLDPAGAPSGRVGEHRPPGLVPERLVVVIRSELFRRYPATLVSLAPGHTPGQVDRPANLADRTWPEFIAALADDLTMFAFAVDPTVAAQRWIVVEEVPDGIRFATGTALPSWPATDAARAAAALMMPPIRVLLDGAETLT